jgi:hypothetical protein
MHVHYPHCHNPIEIVETAPLAEITCAGCGSSFRLEEAPSSAWVEFSGKTFGRFEVISMLDRGAFGIVLMPGTWSWIAPSPSRYPAVGM